MQAFKLPFVCYAFAVQFILSHSEDATFGKVNASFLSLWRMFPSCTALGLWWLQTRQCFFIACVCEWWPPPPYCFTFVHVSFFWVSIFTLLAIHPILCYVPFWQLSRCLCCCKFGDSLFVLKCNIFHARFSRCLDVTQSLSLLTFLHTQTWPL